MSRAPLNTRRRSTGLSLALALVGVALTLHATRSSAAPPADAWPKFRGPSGDGHSPARQVPLHWTGESNVVWRAEVPGRGWSSPVLGGDRIYLTTAEGTPESGMTLSALAFDAASGRQLWKTEIFQPKAGAPSGHRKNSQASPTPILDGPNVFVHFGHLGTACLDREGRILWKNNAIDYDPVHGNGGSPLLAGNALIFSCDGRKDPFLTALDRDSGKVLWRTDRQVTVSRAFSFCTPELIQVANRPQIISPASGMVAAYDPTDGREIWRARHGGYSVIPKPLFGHGLLFIGTGYDSPTLLAIRPDGTGDVTESHIAWTLRRGVPHTPSLLLVGDELYMLADNGVFSSIDAKTGEVHFQERACGPSSASPIYADGRIYLLDEEGLGVVLKPGKQFVKLAENPLGERTLASYAVTDGTLFIRAESHLYRIGAAPR